MADENYAPGDRDANTENINVGNAGPEQSEPDSKDEGTADNSNDRDPSMISHTGDEPYNAEPPLASLMENGFVTPVNLHYVRCHGPVPEATWEDWAVEVSGLVEEPSSFTMTQLETEFSYQEFPVTLVCSGNRRKEQNMVKKTSGFNWGAAVLSTSLWGGVPLREILERCGIREEEAVYVCFEGAEDLPGDDVEVTKYVTCVKKEIAMDPSRDIILAYKQNGELLTPDHGFPVRMVIPGHIGGRMVKWLKRITITTEEPNNYYHYRDNRVLPSHVDTKIANDEDWWSRPEYIINDLNINSVITTPGYKDILSINTWDSPAYTLKGYAYSGSGKKVTRVEVTMDGGKNWKVCTLDHQEKPGQYGKYWCWCFWSLEVDDVLELLLAQEIAARAWDETQNMQPENLNWNLLDWSGELPEIETTITSTNNLFIAKLYETRAGMMNNCWYRLKTEVRRLDTGEIEIAFKHPVLPGDQSGGWMDSETTPEPPPSGKTYTADEVAKHNSKDSAWIIVHDRVYDVTSFIDIHPGGTTAILNNAGKESTQVFDSIHSSQAKALLNSYYIGDLAPEESSATLASPVVVLTEEDQKNLDIVP